MRSTHGIKLLEIPRAHRNRRSFRHAWDEISYRCDKAGYQLHWRNNPRAAEPHVKRLRRLLRGVKNSEKAIIAQIAKALIAEFEGDWRRGAHYRGREVKLTLRLYDVIASYDKETREFALQGRHKHEVLKQLKMARSFYERHAANAAIARLNAAFKLINNSKKNLKIGGRTG